MPAIMSHGIFGEQVLKTIDGKYLTSDDARAAFLLGCQGPDPFFFHLIGAGSDVSNDFGGKLHKEKMTKAFETYRTYALSLPKKESDIAFAYSLGLLSHYTLDSIAHPFVYAQENAICSNHPDLTNAHKQVHSLIESDIDMAVLDRFHPNQKLDENYPHKYLDGSRKILTIIGEMHAYVANKVYGIDLPRKAYINAIDQMRIVYKFLSSKSNFPTIAASNLERLFGHDYSMIEALSHKADLELPTEATNYKHKEWINPFRETCSTASFNELFDHAISIYNNASITFVLNEPLKNVIRHKNYSGKVLDEDEILR